jgi:hypothetical protein
MRRIITTAALGFALLGGAAACADTTDTASPGASGTPSAAVTSAAAKTGTADKATTCAAVKKLEEEMGAKAVTAFGNLMVAGNDAAKGKAALDELLKVISDSTAEAKKISADATDPEIKAALTEYVAEFDATVAKVKAAGTDIEKATDAFATDAEAAEEKLTKLCAL